MRQRVTYLLPHGTGIDPADIRVGKSDLHFANVEEAAEERRITLSLADLPKELQVFLQDFHELHIRISPWRQYDAFVPAVSRLPPGLHVFFTPREAGQTPELCSAVKRILGNRVKCSSSLDSFNRPPILSERFASSSTYQFYQEPAFLSEFTKHLDADFCSTLSAATSPGALCNDIVKGPHPSYVDIDFDVISHAVTVIVFWSAPGSGSGPSRPTARKDDAGDRLEVGVLSPENSEDPEELSLGGYLTVLGEDGKPNPTLFSFPSRHHPLPSNDQLTYTTHFNTPTGLHPTLNITFPAGTPKPPKPSCALHAYFTFPSSLFIDRYQLSDSLFLSSQNLVALHAISGAQDLEAPDWAINAWGSAALFELAPGVGSVSIPTHLRYINSTSGGEVHVPWPVVFWACEAEQGLKMGTNPFDRVNLGYDGLFGPKTMFYHVPPVHGAVLIEKLTPPTLKEEWNGSVSLGTAVVVLIGFGWVCWQLLRGVMGQPTTLLKEGKKTQ